MAKTFAHIKPDSLAFSLLGAAHAIAQVRGGTALPQALSQVFTLTSASPQARGAMQDIAYRSMRLRGKTDALIGLLAQKPPQPPLLHGLLGAALGLIVAGDDRYDEFTVVDQAVAATAADRKIAHAKGMVNAVLRRFLRERPMLEQRVAQRIEAVWNYPAWWIEETKSSYPDAWESILKTGNLAPPLTLRVNQRKTELDAYLKRLHEAGIQAVRVGPQAVRLARPVPVQQIPGFEEGMVSVQDAAAQLAAPLLDLAPGMRVLDACAAPGGKTGHLLECCDVDLMAIDRDPARLERIRQNLDRLQLHASLKAGDASTADWWHGVAFDRILADVPCTASGIVRRHPDIRWLRRPEDAAQLAAQSARILDNLWTMLRPGGKLLLVTCSIWPLESAMQAQSFTERHQAIRLPAPGQLLPTQQERDDHDGLFYALFQKPPV
ncbi:16S rRNA (cytosine(967)-C(5))-methyltransferase RsmB [Oxalobacteraceae bacterium R-40]|uniref:16S rRNA (Cytosine(967)-C(5))-methyltransferase RsmB n=1 Tax=Keguizhuia sedimenti TaxID=3064264 RepID=A0ABU1BJS0_9BURK|nr:16S rRNA (cytosine(967)-C(5))-methyltransferase RsmB [Oxalobacteraceae bacterium R-40]